MDFGMHYMLFENVSRDKRRCCGGQIVNLLSSLESSSEINRRKFPEMFSLHEMSGKDHLEKQ